MGYTIKDIAQELGVSPTTVSLIINNKPCRVSASTRKAVLDLVKKVNYTPNTFARALVTKRTQTIGLIVPDISNPFFSELAMGVERAAQKEGYSIIFCNSDNSSEKDIKNTALLTSKQVDGLILAPSLGEQDTGAISEFRALVDQNRLPLVLADRTIPYCTYNNTLINHQLGGYLATEHLLKLGHRRIGCITGSIEHDSAQKRYRGYTDALHMAGVPLDENLVYHGDYQVESGKAGAEHLMQRDITAIFACNDLMALGCVRKMREKKLYPPKDISLIGFDDIPLCELLDPPLTTVKQSMYEVGKNAFQMISKLIEHPSTKTESIMLTPKLVIRSTTAAYSV